MIKLNPNEVVTVLNAGHGGSDPGSIGINNIQEKSINLRLTSKVFDIISPTLNTIFIRNSDIDYSPSLIADTVNKIKQYVDAYSFHCNGFLDPNANGTEIFISKSNEEDKEWVNEFLDAFTKKFGFKNRGLKTKTDHLTGEDKYYLHKHTNSNIKFKIMEICFITNPSDYEIITENIDAIANFIANSILTRYDTINWKVRYEKLRAELEKLLKI